MSQDRAELFESWAEDYDQAVIRDQMADAYPFAGYDDVVDAVAVQANILSNHRVLDIGAGTGNLTAKLVCRAGEVWGTDFSERMLQLAQAKVPQAHFRTWNVHDSWPSDLPEAFDRIVSTYVFHEFDDAAKLSLLMDLARTRLLPGGCLVIGDIAFPDASAQAVCRQNAASLWDESEHYWVASRIIPQLEKAGFVVGYKQISVCGGVFVLRFEDAA